jgi:RimJ/RimL family protein N-acetyltransferase
MTLQLATTRLVLVAVANDEAAALRDDAPVKGLAFGPGYPVARTQAVATRRCDLRWRGLALFLILRDGKVIGHCSAERELVTDPSTVWIFYEICPTAQDQGYAKESVRSMVSWALGQPEVERICAEILVGNIASERVASFAGLHPTSKAFGQIWERRRGHHALQPEA